MDKNIGILLVDDDEVDVMNVKRAFKTHGIANPLYIAGNGLEALSMLRGENNKTLRPLPKIILLDINMPKMNGIEFLKELRDDPELQKMCVLVLTTSDEERDRVAAYELNVSGYILKSIDTKDFLDSMNILYQFWSLIRLP